ncbi:HAE1 family hydrophobic/amphiphilic exporter-1/multidrug efflux pump [Sphingomonas vulcanisoli]|uniref:Efflux pump membrane transporter n=1 Tax=Sphingomonas vulcanisoli TaxID=1658060 RepID=A0ABX0TUS2_9SPHN|nr:efflux RND transporter permease subunit [Sphingomonas vulcanisoli]NIJ09277.1 HAE1 family hydrophobic/amphiphilic exporter-1/multidrug efflux pump [Sphingomonas vulcanisoli]
MSRYFIDRPIFAWVVAIVLMLIGVLAIRSMAIAQFPNIAPPAISVTATYPGADAQTLENTTTQVIEQQLKGIDHLNYFSSTSDASGTAVVTLTFAQGTNPDTAQVQVQNKVQAATALLPQAVQLQGLRVAKSVKNFALVIAVYSKDGSHDQDDIGDLVAAKMQDPLSRITGVGDTQLFGSQYAMRVWIDPYKMQGLKITTGDIRNAITAQNAQVSAGQIGGLPTVKNQAINAVVTAQSRLQTAEQFRAIVLKTNTDGSTVTLGDVARVEIGAEAASTISRYNGQPASGIAVKLAPGANALETVRNVKAEIARLQKTFPQDIQVAYPFDSTPFVTLSIHEVVQTLIEAVVLVFLVMLLFLQNWRATLIPTIAVPVVLLGTFGILYAVGFTINTLTLFGTVLAIGLLVDDAIVVVENVERLINEEGLSPLQAAHKSMDEVSGALIGIGVVLSAVFLPMAFFGGSGGVVYRQFSITIVASMVLSVMVALTLTPALCGTLLKPRAKEEKRKGGFSGWFNTKFDRTRDHYAGGVTAANRHWVRTLLVYGLVCAGMVLLFVRLPGGFLPDEDQGVLFAQVVMPAGTPVAKTEAAMATVRKHFLVDEKDNVDGFFNISGFSFGGTGQNVGTAFLRLKSWDDRKGSKNSAQQIANRAIMSMARAVPQAKVIAFAPPAVLELGNATGFDFELKDNGDHDHAALTAARNQLLGMSMQDKTLTQVRPNGLEDAPQLKVNLDLPRATALGLAPTDISDTLSTALGGAYINDFIDRGRVKKVFVQADAPFRTRPEDVNALFVRGSNNVMTPISAFSDTSWTMGPSRLERYNGAPAMELQGMAVPGKSSGDAMNAMASLAAKLPPGFSFDWTGLSYEQMASSGQALPLYGLSLLIVFLCLAALYESWSVPIAVLLVVPLGVVGAVIAATITGLDNDIYFQVGLITTVGLASKNAILIVEFAEERVAGGMGVVEAALESAKLRLRPILMTSLAFVFGVLPLAISTGAGSAGRHAIGRAVVGGMLSGTLLAIFFVPVFFVLVKKLFGHEDEKHPADTSEEPTLSSASPQGE